MKAGPPESPDQDKASLTKAPSDGSLNLYFKVPFSISVMTLAPSKNVLSVLLVVVLSSPAFP